MLIETSRNLNKYIARLRTRAFAHPMRIVLTDGTDPRILAAVRILVAESVIRPVLIGSQNALGSQLAALGLSTAVDIYDPNQDAHQARLVELLSSRFEARGKIIPSIEALQTMALLPTYCGMLLVQSGMADGLVGGAATPTAMVIRAGIQVVGVNPAYPVVSGAFVMLLNEALPAGQDVLIFSDAAVIPNPNAEQLAAIAITTAHTARTFLEEEPTIALLSFSTHGSAEDVAVYKVREALLLVRKHAPELQVDGELQADAALIPEISLRKAPANTIQGKANILIFPNLDASNIAYKLVERIAGATALGVILSGLAKPVNDLSRGCTTNDIVNMVAVTALQAAAQRPQSVLNNLLHSTYPEKRLQM